MLARLGRRRRGRRGYSAATAPKLLVLGLASGALSGFFGIGGGFLIVPGLMLATGMPILNAIASSLVAVAAFAVIAAANYARSGLVDWWLAAMFVGGGVLGGLAGVATGKLIGPHDKVLRSTFAGIVILICGYVCLRGALAFL